VCTFLGAASLLHECFSASEPAAISRWIAVDGVCGDAARIFVALVVDAHAASWRGCWPDVVWMLVGRLP
jgi:hypothetical protein